jgi:hypothetical protein
MKVPMTLWETKTFIRQSEELLSPDELNALRFSLGIDPEAGDLIPNTGGARKLRWRAGSQGKSAVCELSITSAGGTSR